MENNFKQIRKWFENTLQKNSLEYGSFAISKDAQETILSSSFACHVFELFDGMHEISPERKKEWADFFIDCQNEKTGLFIDRSFDEKDTAGSHDIDYIYWQFTYFSLHALDILGYRPKYALSFLDNFCDGAYLEEWFAKRNWSNFWLESNNIMFLLFFLAYKIESGKGKEKCIKAVDFIFGILDKEQDPKTGYWGTNKGASLFNGMAGASHIYFFYLYFGRKIFFKEQIINSTLSLQDPEGLFSPAGTSGGGSCEDLDAINILCLVSSISSHKKIKIWLSLRRSYKKIKNSADKDTNAYAYKLNASEDKWSYSGWKAMETSLREPDSWSTYFRYLSLAFIENRYGKKNIWKFRRLPSLGWFDNKLISQYKKIYEK